jgi:hypothetical protein
LTLFVKLEGEDWATASSVRIRLDLLSFNSECALLVRLAHSLLLMCCGKLNATKVRMGSLPTADEDARANGNLKWRCRAIQHYGSALLENKF